MLKPAIHTFLTVCRTGSFTKAARELFITPSAVIQQINALEEDLQAVLFERTPRGVIRTEAGTFLMVHCEELANRSREIRQNLRDLSIERKSICIGTSLMEKCRLLYDLWVLFSEQEKAYEIKMMNIEADHRIPERTDLIESVNGAVPWTKQWNFMQLCRVPFGFAIPAGHPLTKRDIVTLDALRGETVLSINPGTSPDIADMLRALKEHDIHVIYPKESGSSILWECAFRPCILIAPTCWDDILINMEMKRSDLKITIPYGIFYRPEPSEATAHFLDFIRLTYSTGNPQGMVPVL